MICALVAAVKNINNAVEEKHNTKEAKSSIKPKGDDFYMFELEQIGLTLSAYDEKLEEMGASL